MNKLRLDHEMPKCFSEWGWKYHHIGIPTHEQKQDEKYLSRFKLYVSGFDTSPFGIEWMRLKKALPSLS